MRCTAQKNGSLAGSLEMVILRTLWLRDLHGYGIVRSIQRSAGNELLIEEGSLYPALQRLEANGWIDGVWSAASGHRRTKTYRITTAGRKQLETCADRVGLHGVKSCLVFGCVVTGVAFGRQPAYNVDVCMEPRPDLTHLYNQGRVVGLCDLRSDRRESDLA